MMIAGGVLLVVATTVLVTMVSRRANRGRALASICAVTGAAALLWVAAGQAAPNTERAEPPTEAEKRGLLALHRNTVEIFVERPGFGVRRLALPLSDVISPPKSLYEPEEEKPSGTPAANDKDKKKPGHYSVQDMVTAGRAGRVLTDDKKEHWKVLTVQLLGLVKHPDPVVYLTDKASAENAQARKAEKEVATRAPNEFEKWALEGLQRREDLKAEKRGCELHMVAPIYAGKRCVACHEKGQLLGAFSYTMERVAVEPEKGRDGGRTGGP